MTDSEFTKLLNKIDAIQSDTTITREELEKLKVNSKSGQQIIKEKLVATNRFAWAVMLVFVVNTLLLALLPMILILTGKAEFIDKLEKILFVQNSGIAGIVGAVIAYFFTKQNTDDKLEKE